MCLYLSGGSGWRKLSDGSSLGTLHTAGLIKSWVVDATLSCPKVGYRSWTLIRLHYCNEVASDVVVSDQRWASHVLTATSKSSVAYLPIYRGLGIKTRAGSILSELFWSSWSLHQALSCIQMSRCVFHPCLWALQTWSCQVCRNLPSLRPTACLHGSSSGNGVVSDAVKFLGSHQSQSGECAI